MLRGGPSVGRRLVDQHRRHIPPATAVGGGGGRARRRLQRTSIQYEPVVECCTFATPSPLDTNEALPCHAIHT